MKLIKILIVLFIAFAVLATSFLDVGAATLDPLLRLEPAGRTMDGDALLG